MVVASYQNKDTDTSYLIEHITQQEVLNDFKKVEHYIPADMQKQYLLDMEESAKEELAYSVVDSHGKVGFIYLKKLTEEKYFAVSMLVNSPKIESKFVLLSYVLDNYDVIIYKPINNNHLSMKAVITTRSLAKYNQGIIDYVYLTSNGRSTTKMLKYFGLE